MTTKAREAFWDVALGNNTKLANLAKLAIKEAEDEAQQQRNPLWINPNDKTQKKFLPNIGEPILFCHKGNTYYGQHNGGSFQLGYGVTKRYYDTWSCHWMYLPAAHGIIKE
jgi:hypothetical protein